MKIFISHASANKEYGTALVELLTGIGIKAEEIVFTSNSAFGIPIGQNIFDWLKAQISQGCFVVYLLSDEYYESIACLNEMGAAWIIENQHAAIFLPNFQISGKHFQSGAIDPREIGFKMNEEDRVNEFCQMLSEYFAITTNFALLAQRVKKFLSEVDVLAEALKPVNAPTNDRFGGINKEIKFDRINLIEGSTDVAKSEGFVKKQDLKPSSKILEETIENAVNVKESFKDAEAIHEDLPKVYTKFLKDFEKGKISDVELLLLNFVLETSRTKFGVGWKMDGEIKYIHDWEDIEGLNHSLSRNYDKVIRKFEMRGLIEVSEVTGGGNPREMQLIPEIKKLILDLPEALLKKIRELVEINGAGDEDDSFVYEDLPF